MHANTRQDAHFTIDRKSATLGRIRWTVTVTNRGLEATRSLDRRRLTVSWERLLGTLLFFGYDSSERTQGGN